MHGVSARSVNEEMARASVSAGKRFLRVRRTRDMWVTGSISRAELYRSALSKKSIPLSSNHVPFDGPRCLRSREQCHLSFVLRHCRESVPDRSRCARHRWLRTWRPAESEWRGHERALLEAALT